MSARARGWIVVLVGLDTIVVASAVAAASSAGVAKPIFALELLSVPVVAFMASRYGHNMLFGAVFMTLSAFAMAAGTDLVRVLGLSWLEDYSFWALALIDIPPLFVIGLIIGAVATLTRPANQDPDQGTTSTWPG